jgi:hypothetical protein
MFVENYRQESGASIMAGGDTHPIPYPKITDEDWRVWRIFLPVRTMNLDQAATTKLGRRGLNFTYGIPYALTGEIQKATEYFDKVEVWRKHEVNKDPIAVGIIGEERYLIARWGMDKLIPFEAIKKSAPWIQAWNYATSPAGALAGVVGFAFLAWGFFF